MLASNSKEKKGFNNVIRSISQRKEVSVVGATLGLFLIFAIASSNFLSAYNLFNISRTASLYIFIALAQAIVVVIGGMNVSVGSIGALAVVTLGYSIQVLQLPITLSIILALIIAMMAGFFNGFIITKLKLNAFVVTLATNFIFTGLVMGFSKGTPYTDIPKSFTALGRGGALGLPYLFWLVLVLLAILAYFFKFSVLGRHILATGGNVEAARLSGINTDKIIIIAHILSGVLSGIAGCLTVSRAGSAGPATGSDWMIISFAVAVIGGTSLSGGEFTSIGMLAAGFMIALIKNGLVMVGVNVYYEQTFLGFIILLAISIESINFIVRGYKIRKQGGLSNEQSIS